MVDGGWTVWSPWAPCTASCGGTRQLDGGWTVWSPWAPCTASCGGTRQRVAPPLTAVGRCGRPGHPVRRPAAAPGSVWRPPSRHTYAMFDSLTAVGRCGRPGHPVRRPAAEPGSVWRPPSRLCLTRYFDGGWTVWSPWAPCTASCGGTRQRARTCDAPAPAHGGSYCPGDMYESQPCEPGPGCAVTCSVGRRVRTRSCTNPRPRYAGRYCTGPNTEQEKCGEHNPECYGRYCTGPNTEQEKCGEHNPECYGEELCDSMLCGESGVSGVNAATRVDWEPGFAGDSADVTSAPPVLGRTPSSSPVWWRHAQLKLRSLDNTWANSTDGENRHKQGDIRSFR
ncbi:hypothetical protein Bbelb_335900 [Branchiostoma belcheri]|nr:hypothetical protein Bbelb_335900 [Branchiostoma belcheri]